VSDGRPRFLAITGPTASGKTDLSVALAERIRLEVVSMDSRQVYRGMDIGTDKVRDDARTAVPHHGLDLVSPDERYSAGRFARDVRRWIPEIEGRGAVPVLVGGTGFFLRAVVDPIFAEPEMDEDRLERLRVWLRSQPRDRLERWVTARWRSSLAGLCRGGTARLRPKPRACRAWWWCSTCHARRWTVASTTAWGAWSGAVWSTR
jgi:tRNA A37 N6-isopentenylltransferase MiaA